MANVYGTHKLQDGISINRFENNRKKYIFVFKI